MEINHLKYFYAVAKANSFTRGAADLNIAQPVVSRFVKQLEDDLQQTLFERVGRKIKLTKQGADLLRHCEIIFSEFEKIKAKPQTPEQGLQGSINVGAAEVVGRFMIPAAIQKLSDMHPLVYPWVAVGQTADLCQKVLDGSLDMAWLFHAPDLGAELEVRKSYPVPFALVVATDYAHTSHVLTSFIGSREVDNVAARQYPTLKRLQRDYPAAKITVSTNSLSAHKELVLRGKGVAILPEFMVRAELQDKLLSKLYPREEFVFQLKLLVKRAKPLNEAAQSFIKNMEDAVAQMT